MYFDESVFENHASKGAEATAVAAGTSLLKTSGKDIHNMLKSLQSVNQQSLMKKKLFILAMSLSVGASAHQSSTLDLAVCDSVTVPSSGLKVAEPEFINSYCILTSDSTYAVLPRENGFIGEHKNKTKSLLGKIGKVASAASAIGGLGAAIGLNANSASAALTGLKAANTAWSVSEVADATSALAGASGMDIIFKGKASSYIHKLNAEDVKILIKAENNKYDPAGLYRIVKFYESKKERRIQWLQFEDGVIDEDAKKKGYIPFTAQKFGVQSYLLTIPASELEEGEYGIIYMGVETATMIPVGTFGIH